MTEVKAMITDNFPNRKQNLFGIQLSVFTQSYNLIIDHDSISFKALPFLDEFTFSSMMFCCVLRDVLLIWGIGFLEFG